MLLGVLKLALKIERVRVVGHWYCRHGWSSWSGEVAQTTEAGQGYRRNTVASVTIADWGDWLASRDAVMQHTKRKTEIKTREAQQPGLQREHKKFRRFDKLFFRYRRFARSRKTTVCTSHPQLHYSTRHNLSIWRSHDKQPYYLFLLGNPNPWVANGGSPSLRWRNHVIRGIELGKSFPIVYGYIVLSQIGMDGSSVYRLKTPLGAPKATPVIHVAK
jgi:hypothetical protein